MVQTSIFDTIKDKASKLLPTPYTDIVEECTQPHLTEPIYEDVMLIIDSANTKPDAVEDILRAVRSRLDDDDPGVQHLTILLLQALIQNCGSSLHREVASQKILLRDLISIAANVPVNVRGLRAMEAARCLILNLSIWFAGCSDISCFILTTLANDVRQVAGPNAFAGCTSDSQGLLHDAQRGRRRDDQHAGTGALRSPGTDPVHKHRSELHDHMRGSQESDSHRSSMKLSPQSHKVATHDGPGARCHDAHRYVHAIPVMLPTEQRTSTMFEISMALSDYLQNMENASRTNEAAAGTETVAAAAPPRIDDVVREMAQVVQEDHNYVALLLSSDLDVDRDLLRTIGDTQTTVLRRVATLRSPSSVAQDGGSRAQMHSTSGQAEQHHELLGIAASHQTVAHDPPHPGRHDDRMNDHYADSINNSGTSAATRSVPHEGAESVRTGQPSATAAAASSLDALFASPITPAAAQSSQMATDMSLSARQNEKTCLAEQTTAAMTTSRSMPRIMDVRTHLAKSKEHDCQPHVSYTDLVVDTKPQESMPNRETIVEGSTSHTPTMMLPSDARHSELGGTHNKQSNAARTGEAATVCEGRNLLGYEQEGDISADAMAASKNATKDDDDFDTFLEGHIKN